MMAINFQKDKFAHYWGSVALTFIGSMLFGPVIGIALALVAGIAKELYDEKWGTGFSRADLYADIVGIGCGALAFAATWWYLA